MRHREKVDRALGIVQLRGRLASGAHLGDYLVEDDDREEQLLPQQPPLCDQPYEGKN